jgi:hypothetical protein
MISAPAFAQTPESSVLPVTEPLDVGGTILQPGTYLIRVIPSDTDRNKVQVTSMDGMTVYATALTVPHPLEPNEEVPNTTFIYFPAAGEHPRALRTWFAPDPEASQGGHDFVYPEGRARMLAEVAQANVVMTRENEEDLFVITPEAEVETYTYIAPTTPVVTETQTLTTIETETPQPMVSSQLEMPATASKTPLVALLGLLALVGAMVVRFTR